MENVPKVKMLDYDIDNIQFNPPIDSSDMDVSHWQDIARSIAEHYEKYDGFRSAARHRYPWPTRHQRCRSCSATWQSPL